MSTAFIYNDIFRNSNYGQKHPVTVNRVTNVYDLSKILGFENKVDYFYNEIASDEQLCTFHNKDYINILKLTEQSQCINKEDSLKYNLGTFSNPIFKEMFRRHASAAGALLLATKLIKSKYNYIFSPGSGAHHARQNKASGFCYINDIAICIKRLKTEGYTKILYYDMDAHYGDGVVEYFRKDTQVMTISIHQHNLWPRNKKFEFNKDYKIVNIPLREKFSDENFINLLKEDFFYPNIIKFDPEVILMQMGADCLKEDKFSDLNLSNNSMMYIIKKMKDLNSKIIVMGGGGYNPWVILRAWIYNLATLSDNENLITLNESAKQFIKKIKWKEKPQDIWLKTIKDVPNIFVK